MNEVLQIKEETEGLNYINLLFVFQEQKMERASFKWFEDQKENISLQIVQCSKWGQFLVEFLQQVQKTSQLNDKDWIVFIKCDQQSFQFRMGAFPGLAIQTWLNMI